MHAHPPGNRSTSILLANRKRRCTPDSAHGEATCIVSTSALHLLSRADSTSLKIRHPSTSSDPHLLSVGARLCRRPAAARSQRALRLTLCAQPRSDGMFTTQPSGEKCTRISAQWRSGRKLCGVPGEKCKLMPRSLAARGRLSHVQSLEILASENQVATQNRIGIDRAWRAR